MGDSRLHRLEQALDKAITSALASSCNEEAFLSFFSECDGEDSRRKLLNLRELFVQLLVASVEVSEKSTCFISVLALGAAIRAVIWSAYHYTSSGPYF